MENKNLVIKTLQEETNEWAIRNFGETPPWMQLLGMTEEVGEIAHSYLKMEQQIRGTRDEHMEKIRDGVGDLVIFLCNFCNRMNIDLETEIEKTWAEVKRRDWVKARKENGWIEEAA